MFDNLTGKLQEVFKKLSKRGKLSEADVDEALREVRLALLEADVHFKVVKEFIARVRVRAVGAEVGEALNPAQQVIKIVREELQATMGGTQTAFTLPSARPADVRGQLEKAMNEATAYANKISESENAEARDEIKKSGKTEIIIPTGAEMAAMQKAMEPLYQDMASRVGKQLIDDVRKTAQGVTN